MPVLFVLLVFSIFFVFSEFFGVWLVAEGGWTPAGSSQALLPCPAPLSLPGTGQGRNGSRGTFT